MRTLNSQEKRQASRFYFLLPLACLSVGFGSGFITGHEKAYRDLTIPDPLHLPSEATKARSILTPSHGINLEWRGNTRSGEPIRENEQKGIQFVF